MRHKVFIIWALSCEQVNIVRMRRICRKMYKITAISPAKHDAVKRLIYIFGVHRFRITASVLFFFLLFNWKYAWPYSHAVIFIGFNQKNNVNNSMET